MPFHRFLAGALDPLCANALIIHIRQSQERPEQDRLAHLSEHDQVLLEFIASGLTNAEIGNHLALAESTVKG